MQSSVVCRIFLAGRRDVLHGFLIAAVAVVFSLSVEAIAFPRASLRRPLAAIVLHAAAFGVLAGGCFAVTARPLFSVCMVLVLIALLVIISNAKYESLREPFVFTDLSLFSQVFSHPRLYLPFLGVGKILVVLVGATAVVTGFVLEQPAPQTLRVAAALIALCCLPVCLALPRFLHITLEPISDQRRFGFFATFMAYLVNGLGRAEQQAFVSATGAGPFSSGRPEMGPDVIVIQSESYFDARRLGRCVVPDPYENFDRAKEDAFEYGRLAVPAWGANTMRSEFAMLTGLSPATLGYARFYPYRYVRRACASLAGWFRRGGYRTVAVHPYYADFFGRRRAFRCMQFDEFLDIRHFGNAVRAGPYVGDDAVADALIALLKKPDYRPLFAFAITMENHGPLHLESVAAGESAGKHTLGDSARWRDLTAYLRHVENADRMLGKLMDYLRKRERSTVLCLYGDHVPALGAIFDALGREPIDTDYLIWRNFGDDFGKRRDIPVENLGSAIQRAQLHENCIGAGSPNVTKQMSAQ